MSRNTLKRTLLTLVSVLLLLSLLVGAAGCHKKEKLPDADVAASVTKEAKTKDKGFLQDLLGKQEDEKTTEEDKTTKADDTKKETTKAPSTVAATQEGTRQDTAPSTTLSSGLFQVSQDYKQSHNYAIAVNTSQNMVIIYAKGDDGNYTVPVKAMAASCGRAGHETPSGQYTTLAKQRWLYLIDGTYGQYCTKFKEHYWFHSVPYYTQSPADLEWPEYNKLGNNASAGCVRLCVRDVKWLYDNISLGTVVRVYASSAAEPIVKPAPVRIDTSDTNVNRGWDPTDPDPGNPYHLS